MHDCSAPAHWRRRPPTAKSWRAARWPALRMVCCAWPMHPLRQPNCSACCRARACPKVSCSCWTPRPRRPWPGCRCLALAGFTRAAAGCRRPTWCAQRCKRRACHCTRNRRRTPSAAAWKAGRCKTRQARCWPRRRCWCCAMRRARSACCSPLGPPQTLAPGRCGTAEARSPTGPSRGRSLCSCRWRATATPCPCAARCCAARRGKKTTATPRFAQPITATTSLGCNGSPAFSRQTGQPCKAAWAGGCTPTTACPSLAPCRRCARRPARGWTRRGCCHAKRACSC